MFRRFLAIYLMSCAWVATSEATEILVKYRSIDGSAEFAAKHRSAPSGRHIGHGVFSFPVASVASNEAGLAATKRKDGAALQLEQQLGKFRADPNVEYAEPNYHGHFTDAPAVAGVPNDPGYGSQWWLEALSARQGWAVATGKGSTVAVVDSGVDLRHPDLSANLRTDGYNFGDDNATPQDEFGHGTFVAGIVAAQCNNALSGCGLAPDASVLPIKINPGGKNDFTTEAVQRAIDYAVAKGAQIISLSLEFTAGEEPQTVKDALQRAFKAGVVVVAAVGNDGWAVGFPAKYPGVIAVAGTDRNGSLASFSNRGPEVAIAAPATAIQSTLLGGGFGTFLSGQGTSYAAPAVAATIALLLQADRRLGSRQLVALMRDNARPLATNKLDFDILDSGRTLLALLPDLQPTRNAFAQSDTLRLDYRLPPTAGPVDIYVALKTPIGEFSLRPDGRWAAAEQAGYAPLVTGFASEKAASGTLFGNGGVLPPISLIGMPLGKYTWRVALFDPLARTLVGRIVESPVTLE